LARLESVLANQRVRNSGTIGGNLAFAEPHGDPPALLVVADAEIRLESAAGSRTVPLDGWIRGPFDPDLAPDELLAEIQIPIPAPGTSFGYERFRALERPSVTVAARIDVGESGQIVDVRIVVGCVAGYAQRIRGAEGILRGRLLEELEGLLPAASGAASEEVEAATDSHGPEDYKRHLAGVLLGRALRRAVQDRLAAPPAGMRR